MPFLLHKIVNKNILDIVFCSYNCLYLLWNFFSKCQLLVFPVLKSRKTVLRNGCASSRPKAKNLLPFQRHCRDIHIECSKQFKWNFLCVWAEPAILGNAKTALKFKYEIWIGYNTNTIQCMWLGISLNSERNNPWFKPWFNILRHATV